MEYLLGLETRFLLFFHFRFGKVSLNLTRNVDVFWHPIGKDWNNENEFKNLIEVASNMQVTQRLHFIFQILTHVIVAATLIIMLADIADSIIH